MPRPFNGEMAIFSTNGVGKTYPSAKEWSCTFFFTPYTKIISKWIKDLNVIAKAIKLSEVSIVEKLHDIEFGSVLLDMTPKASATKEKIDKLNVIEIKSFMHQEHCQLTEKATHGMGKKYLQIVCLLAENIKNI